jgi:putative hemolysin
MIKWRLWLVGFLLLVAAFVYILAENLPDQKVLMQEQKQSPQQSSQQQQTTSASSSAGLANPASVNCVQTLGGQLQIVDTAQGQIGMCHLPDGRVCEEWALFRDGSCVTENGQ